MIPLVRPSVGQAEIEAVSSVLRSGMLVQGANVRRFEEMLAQRCGRSFAIAVSNGTAALELALEAIERPRGSGARIPGLSWPSPGHAAKRAGLDVELFDVGRESWNLEACGSSLTIAIDQFGMPVERETFAVANSDAVILEDAACAIGSLFADGSPCGSLGTISCLSFHPRKIVTTGEGGACLTDDEGLAQRLRELRNHGQHGLGAKRPGSPFARAAGNYRLTDFQAALGIQQLMRLDDEIAGRESHAATMKSALGNVLQFQKTTGRPNYQTLGALLPETVKRDSFIAECRERGVQAGLLSYELSAIGTLGEASTPNSAEIVRRGIALPLFAGLRDQEVAQVIEVTQEVLVELGKR